MMDIEYKFNRFMFRADTARRRRLWLKLAKLLSNGVPILDALGSIHARRVQTTGGRDTTSIAIGDWVSKIRNGRRISQSIQGWVGHDEQMLIAAGEQSGKVDEALRYAAEIMESKKKIKQAVIGGLAYPMVMIMIAFSVLIMFSFKVIPEFSRIVPYEKWHGVARVMIDFADFARHWLPFIIAFVVLLIFAFFFSLPRWSEGLRVKLDRFLPYSVYRMLEGSTWMISFAALVNAGMRVENALQELAKDSTPWMNARIQACLQGMRSGLHAGDALAKSGYGFPDIEIIDDLGVYSKLSGFDHALSIIGKEWITESVERIQGMMQIVFGISVLIVGFFVAFMVGGLISMELQMASILQSSYQ